MPLLLYRIEGGYGVHPRWSNKVRRGKMHAFVSRVVEPEEYLAMSDDELFELISKELYVDEGRLDYTYKSKRLAEYMERVFYVCPDCGLTTFRSDKDLMVCQKCGKTARYLPTKQFAGVNGDFPFEFTTEWYDYQSNFINALPLQAYGDKCLFKDEVSVFEVILYDRKKILQRNTEIRLCADKISFKLGEEVVDLPYEKISAVAVLGKNKLNIYYEGKLYQVKGDERFNALKYVHLYYRAKNILKGEENGKFLGL
jgi:1-acyl-sn-glycerol-3-phosphate acyltransferase